MLFFEDREYSRVRVLKVGKGFFKIFMIVVLLISKIDSKKGMR